MRARSSVLIDVAADQTLERVLQPLLELPVDHEFTSKVLLRPTVAAFCNRFGVEPERTRLTGAHPWQPRATLEPVRCGTSHVR